MQCMHWPPTTATSSVNLPNLIKLRLTKLRLFIAEGERNQANKKFYRVTGNLREVNSVRRELVVSIKTLYLYKYINANKILHVTHSHFLVGECFNIYFNLVVTKINRMKDKQITKWIVWKCRRNIIVIQKLRHSIIHISFSTSKKKSVSIIYIVHTNISRYWCYSIYFKRRLKQISKNLMICFIILLSVLLPKERIILLHFWRYIYLCAINYYTRK